MKNLQIVLIALLASTIVSDVVNLGEGWYYIKNAVSGKYLQVRYSESKAGANIEIGTGNKGNNQKWKISNLSNGYITLTSFLGNFATDIAYGKDENGANIQIFDNYSGDAQQFRLLSSSNQNAYFIAAKVSSDSKVICVENDSSNDGSNVHLWANLNRNEQTWIFEKLTDEEQKQEPSGNQSPLNNAVPSKGCGRDLRLTKTGSFEFNWSQGRRTVRIDIPDNYDKNKPYRLIFGMHCMGGWAGGVQQEGYYGLKHLDTGKTSIFIAPEGNGNQAPWGQGDYILFDELLEYLKGELCIDTTRVFSAGFSYGSMFTNGLAWNHQKVLRAVAVYEVAERNIWLPQHTGEPIAWMGVLGLNDNLCTPEMGRKARDIILSHNSPNGVAVKENAEEAAPGGPHKCYDYKTVNQNYPVRWCTQSGGHIWDHKDPGQGRSWVPQTTWDFFTKF